MSRRFQDAVFYSGLGCAAFYGGWLFLRSGLGIGAYEALAGGERFDAGGREVRRVVWEEPRALPFPVPDLTVEGRPALSPDGRLLVFARGARGANADLWVADLEEGIPLEPRPLALLATPADELAPCLAEGWLWFASDRGNAAGDLDLWRVRFETDVQGEAERAPAHLRSPADDTEPALLDDGRIVFVSNRGPDRAQYDLYLADPLGTAAPLALLPSPAQERDPAFAAGALWFASDRGGRFELQKSFLHGGEFQRAEPIPFASSPPALRAPSPSSDGFELAALGLADEGRAELVRIRSRELLRIPGPGVTGKELLVVALLLLGALLAWLARRGTVLDLLLKCYLLSLLVHLLLLLLLRHARPESESFGPRADDGVFRVRLEPAPEERPSALAERAGKLEVARADGAASAPLRAEASAGTLDAAPGALDLQAPAAEQRANALAARALDRPEPTEHVALEVALPASGGAPEDLVAPAFEVASTPIDAEPAASEPGSPLRAAAAQPRSAGNPEVPASMELALAPAPDGAERAAPRPARLGTSTRPAPTGASASVALPRESFEVLGSSAPGLALEPIGVVAKPAPPANAPSRWTVSARSDQSSPALGAGLEAIEVAVPSRRAASPTPAAHSIERGGAPLASQLPMRGPIKEDTLADPSAGAAPSFHATSGLAAPTAAGEPRAPDMLEGVPSRMSNAAETSLAPAPRGLELPSLERGEARDSDLPAPRSLARPAVEIPGREVALQAPVEEASRIEGVGSAPRFDATEGLAERALAQPAAPRGTQGPARAATGDETDLELMPAKVELAPLARESTATTLDAPPRAELDDTPYRNRFGPAKLRALEEYGGSAQTERAVALGLAYLARVQQRDGSFGSAGDRDAKYRDVRVGKTGLALLAFLGAGHTQSSASEYSSTVRRALDWLCAAQDEESGHIGDSEAYGHGIATYALSECFALTRDETLRGVLERAVGRVVGAQDTREDPELSGGWSYYFRETGATFEGDDWPRASVSAWQIMALESARLAGIEVADSAFDEARRFLIRLYDPRRGAFRYDHDPERLASGYPILPASTPAALFCLSLLGVDLGAPELAQARHFVLARAPRDYERGSNDDFIFEAKGNVYFWYYASLAMFRVGGREWERWNLALQEVLLPSQDPDGSWQPVCVYSDYAGDDEDDKSYTTAMNVLSLEVYYRYFTPLLSVR